MPETLTQTHHHHGLLPPVEGQWTLSLTADSVFVSCSSVGAGVFYFT